MRWSRSWPVGIAAAVLVACLLPLRSQEERRVSIYAARTSFSLPVTEREKAEYVSLFEAVEPVGDATMRIEPKGWRLRFNGMECEFRPGKKRVRLGRADFDMPGPFLVDGDRGYVPLPALPALYSRLLNTTVNYHVASRRIFVGDVATRFTIEKRPEALVVSFSTPVNPTISTEPGKLKMTFTREPVVSTTPTVQLDDKLISAVQFNESNGTAELVIQTNAPVMANFADNGKTIRVVPTPVLAQTAPTPAAPAPTATPGPEASPAAPLPASPAAVAGAAAGALHQPYLIIVDASHGGDERGAALTDQLAEKDVTLAFARKLRAELQARGLNTLMLRDSDTTVPLEQRAEVANASRAAVYISLHASSMGSGVRLYTAMLPPSDAKVQAFIPWESAQAGRLPASRLLAQAVAVEVAKRELPSTTVAAPVRPLNNVMAAAIAVEVSPPNRQVEGLSSSNYQQQIAAAVATGIANAREAVEGTR